MRRSTISRPLALLAVAFALVAGACGGAAVSPIDAGPAEARMDAMTATERTLDAGGAQIMSVAVAPGLPAGDVGVEATGPMIIRTGTLTLQVGDVDASVADAQRIVTAAGGYVAGSDRSFDGDQPVATLTLRIPAERWDATLAELRKLSVKVLGEQTSSVEVTAQARDLDARIINLRASETALLGIMVKATRVTDILEVQSQLTSVRGEIEQLTSERKQLGDQAAQGTLTTSFVLAAAPIETTTKGWDPGAEVSSAVAALIGMGQGVAGGAIWFVIVILPLLLLILIVGLPIAYVARRVRRRTRKPSTGAKAAGADETLWVGP